MLAIVPRGASLWVGCFVVMVVHYYGAYLFPFSASLHPDDMLLPTYLSSRGALLGSLSKATPRHSSVQFSSVRRARGLQELDPRTGRLLLEVGACRARPRIAQL